MKFEQFRVEILNSAYMREYIGTIGKVIDEDKGLKMYAVRLIDNYIKWYDYNEVRRIEG